MRHCGQKGGLPANSTVPADSVDWVQLLYARLSKRVDTAVSAVFWPNSFLQVTKRKLSGPRPECRPIDKAGRVLPDGTPRKVPVGVAGSPTARIIAMAWRRGRYEGCRMRCTRVPFATKIARQLAGPDLIGSRNGSTGGDAPTLEPASQDPPVSDSRHIKCAPYAGPNCSA